MYRRIFLGQFLQDYAPFDITPLTLNLGVEELSWGGLGQELWQGLVHHVGVGNRP